MIVLDASAIFDYLLRTEIGTFWVRPRVVAPGETLHAPYVIDLEVASALRRQERAREISERRAETALADFRELDLVRYPHVQLLDRIWALRAALTAYDAAYVALAEALGAPLVTTDAALARSTGHRARIESFSG